MYLLGVLSEDKTSEMTLMKQLRVNYAALPSTLPSELTSLVLQTALAHHTRRFENPTYESLITALTAETTTPLQSQTIQGPSGSRSSSVGTTSLTASSLLNNTYASSSPYTSYSNSPPMSGTNPMNPPHLSLDDGSPAAMFRAKGFLIPTPSGPPSRHGYIALIEEVLGKYWHASGCTPKPGDAEAEPHGDRSPRPNWRPGEAPAPADWVYLATPFVCCLARPIAVFYGFENLMDRMSTCGWKTRADVEEDFPPLPSRLGTMLGLFRLALPELHAYFEDEQVPMTQVAMSWMTTLLSREMWLGDVLRLWGEPRYLIQLTSDSYFASNDMFELHCYVCVAILATCKE